MVPPAGVEPTLANYLLHTGYKSAVLPLNYRGKKCKYCMANQKDIDLLFNFIKSISDHRKNNRAAYQLGYLIGFIARLMSEDSMVKSRIIHRINTIKK